MLPTSFGPGITELPVDCGNQRTPFSSSGKLDEEKPAETNVSNALSNPIDTAYLIEVGYQDGRVHDCRSRRWQEVSCAINRGEKDSTVYPPRKVVGVPVIDRDENGNIFMRTAKVGEGISFGPIGDSVARFMPSSKSSSTSSRQISTDSGASKYKPSRSSREGPGNEPSKVQASKSSSNTKPTNAPPRRGPPAVKTPSGPPQYSKAARRFYNEKFREPQRLAKVLAAAGVASRRGSEEVVFAGRVTVNGQVCKVPQTPVDPLKDSIYVDGKSLPKKLATKMYFALNKPKGYICSSVQEGTRPVLSLLDDYFKIWAQRNPGLPLPRMFTVGRLDVATSGLLLVTNDGDFANKVSHPSSGLTKEYIVTVNEKVTRRQLAAIAGGTMVQGVKCVPMIVESIEMEPDETRQRVKIVVSEGRNHEVRHLVENAGLEVLALKRTRIGGLRLSRKLGLGKFDELTEEQVAKVLDKNLQNTV
ncbi:hypothetical protein R1flu_021213 [Riccia fluitans]|uniref:RNA-binding S4 domain-containing protein n=1 Tax=Riccia fluitans TaxID=41844 RepID=A0ABD1ZNQ2_9MARC